MTSRSIRVACVAAGIAFCPVLAEAQHVHGKDSAAHHATIPAEITDAEATAADRSMSSNGTMNSGDMKAMAAHMEMTPRRAANRADSDRAAMLVTQLRSAIGQYRDVTVAEADGFKQFAPQLKNQRVYHFTNYRWALGNEFRFNPEKPTSLLYSRDKAGKFVLVGAMYTAPKRYGADDLDKRVPLSVAQWHKHVNWCLPGGRQAERWKETMNGRPVFGPLGVSTRKECDAAGGRFRDEVFGWMVHANVFAGDDPKVIWGDDHQMTGDEMGEHKH
ncbi:MAG: hypothetical protein M3Q09_03535 [Gemmatimonadota bacterium]|nr:hypothetical protein [Gemmatimonadota bacterium]